MSARRSTALPRACSGAMYAAVPRIVPSSVPAVSVGDSAGSLEAGSACGASAFARPKSRTFTVPSHDRESAAYFVEEDP